MWVSNAHRDQFEVSQNTFRPPISNPEAELVLTPVVSRLALHIWHLWLLAAKGHHPDIHPCDRAGKRG